MNHRRKTTPIRRDPTFRPANIEGLELRVVMSAALAHVVIRNVRESASDAVHVIRNVVYRDVPGDRQTLDLLVPNGPAPVGGRPIIVAIHGGGWRKFSNAEYEPVVAPLAKLGYIIALPNYRLSHPGSPTWPVNFEEVEDAVRWVRSNAANFGGDPDKIAAMGESAGGHLAALLGTDAEDSARVQAVVDFYGPTDLATLERTSPDASLPIRQYLGTTPARDPGRYADASPITHVSVDDPPFLIVQGTADPLVFPAQSRALAARLAAVGVRHRLVLVPGAGHGFGLKVGGLNLVAQVDGFLRATWD